VPLLELEILKLTWSLVPEKSEALYKCLFEELVDFAEENEF
jgi:hypothetical protein